MKKIKAEIVVGLGYGDEGKGLTVDWLCEKAKKPIVVRFSGGQQAGHTVHRDWIKHTFSNFGSGSMLNCPTYFSEHTTFYPIGIVREKKVLLDKNITPKLVLHPLSKMTTPWDVFQNRSCSTTLSHGTCGQGVGVTMKRNEGQYQLRAIDLLHKESLKAKLSKISNYYNIELTTELVEEVKEFYEALDYIISDIQAMNIKIAQYEYLLGYKTIIFEGSQGVLLDMDHGVFPNVTYANTTSKNAMEICNSLNIKDRHVYGVTRSYSTRHGLGNGEYQGEPVVLFNTEGETNVTNQYQGEFLCTKMNYQRLNYAFAIESIYSYNYKKSLVITCCNQMQFGEMFDLGLCDFGNKLKKVYRSYSPTSEKMHIDD